MDLTVEEQTLLAKISTLPPEKVAEVEDFVDFLREQFAAGKERRTP